MRSEGEPLDLVDLLLDLGLIVICLGTLLLPGAGWAQFVFVLTIILVWVGLKLIRKHNKENRHGG